MASNIEAARQDAGASEASYRSVLLSLQADVAQTWFRLRALDAELATVDSAVRLREESVRVNQRRFDLGDIGEFDLTRAKTELSATRAEAIGLQRQRTNAEHALAVLLGRPAARFSAVTSPLPDSVALPAIPAGLPSRLLERRPDIAAAQRAMEAANARIGVARAAMFPALNINAAGGGVGGTMADVFNWSSRSWVLGALLSLPIIDGGRNKANVTRSEAALEESVARLPRAGAGGLRRGRGQPGRRAHPGRAGRAAGRRRAFGAPLGATWRASCTTPAAPATSTCSTPSATWPPASAARSSCAATRRMTTVALIRALGGGWDAPCDSERRWPPLAAARVKCALCGGSDGSAVFLCAATIRA